MSHLSNRKEMRMKKNLYPIVLTIYIFCFFSLFLLSAAQFDTGVIQGKVTGTDGKGIAGVKVMVEGDKIMGGSISVETDKDGNYRFIRVPVGAHTMRFIKSGMATVTKENVKVTIRGKIDINITMQASLEEPAAPKSEEAERILNTAQENVVFYVVTNEEKEEIAKGSGFLVDKNTMVTSYHLLSQAYEAEGRNYEGKKIKIKGILGVDKKHNIAFVEVKGKANGVAIGNSQGITRGVSLFALGGKSTEEIEIESGSVDQIYTLPSGQKVMSSNLEVTDGYCGGPV